MNFKFFVPTKVFQGENCVSENKSVFEEYGNRALVVTGKTSAVSSGALNDVIKVLDEAGIEHKIYDGVQNNPTLENVKEGGEAAYEFGADFVVGIGGGSPLDAAKAIAVLAVNDIKPLELFKSTFKKKPIPIIAIPTTAGTGSEVTPYSILTRKDMQTKMSFGNEELFPKVAFLDARYTESLPGNVAVNTAIDALSHAVEGYLSKRSMHISDVLALASIEVFGDCLTSIKENRLDFDTREKLLYASMLAGMVIAHTGTTIVHGMGYSLTYFRDIPHGEANGMLMAEYLRYNYGIMQEKIENILKLLRIKDIDEFEAVIRALINRKINVSEEELELYASLAMKQRSTSYNAREVLQEDLVSIMRKSLR
ncbi:MAG: iron-containing alcohol dehydrogenase family protein [Clostridia bacterium]|nr:iron-containing alcohol dehydrogenase family protein [Clostridia bacterium]